MEIEREILEVKKELDNILVNFTVGSGTVENIFSKKDTILKQMQLTYKFYLKELSVDQSSTDLFSWYQNKLKIYLVVVRTIEINRNQLICFAIPSSSETDEIVILNHINKKLPLFFNDWESSAQLCYLIENNIIPNVTDNIIWSSFSDNVNHADFWVKSWILKEFKNTEALILPSVQLYNFNKSIIRARRYNFDEMLTIINNEQFSIEFDECLYAYNNQKWFVCAAGLGGCLEHLLYLILEKNGMLDSNFPDDPTAKIYIEYMSRKPLRLKKREKTQLRVLFLTRNSISHYNQGFTSKDQCKALMDGIKNIFENYYNKDFTLDSN